MNRRVYWGVALLAGATLLLEGAMLRWLAVAQFYHFAFLVVSLALLGFAASGTLLSLVPGLQRMPSERLIALCGLAFTLNTGLAYWIANYLPFDSYSIAWDRRQVLYFVLYYLALSLPFLCSGLGIGAALSGSEKSHLVYAANLLGSAAGALLAPVLLWCAGVPGAVLASALLGCLPLLATRERSERLTRSKGNSTRWLRFGFGLWGLGLIGLTSLTADNLRFQAPLGMVLSPYKGLAQALRYPDASREAGHWNAYARLDLVTGAGTHVLPGLSYTYSGPIPVQDGLAIDAGSLQPVTLVSPDQFEAAGYLPEALAFELRPGASALVLEPGGGLGVLQALASGARKVTAVISDPDLPVTIQRGGTGENIYYHPDVHTIPEAARVFLQRDAGKYGVIYLPLTDAYRPVGSGAYSLQETYNLTVQMFARALSHLDEGGILVTTRWLQTPPSESLRMAATLAEALEMNSERPAQGALVAYRGIQTLTTLVQTGGWSAAELQDVRKFISTRRYDLVWAPDIQPSEANRYNRLPEPSYYLAFQALFSAPDRAEFYRNYPYAIAPATDDHPFFYHYFTWGQTPQVLAALGRTWQPFGGSGFLVLLALLGLVLLLGGALVIVPLAAPGIRMRTRRILSRQAPGRTRPPGSSARILAYFTCLGVAFLFVEIPLIQRWILLLGQPIYAFTAVVLSLLLFSSLGSALSRAGWLRPGLALPALALLAFLTPWLVTLLTRYTLAWSIYGRAAAGAISIAPLAVLMGLPFPLGLRRVQAQAPELAAWAWAINGCASVVASVLAAILSISSGFDMVLWCGSAAYAAAFGLYISWKGN